MLVSPKRALVPYGYHGGSFNSLSRVNHSGYQSLQTTEPKGKIHVLLPEDISTRRSFQPICVMFMGRRGQCKSLNMTATAKIQQQRYRRHKVPFHIFSNYFVDFAEYMSPYLVEEMGEFPEWARRAYCCIDEVSGSFPSRRSMARVNLNFATCLTQIRKRQCEIAFTTQFPQVMDVQLLLQVDLFIRCEKHLNGKASEMFIYDWWGQWTGRDFRKPWPPETGSHDWVIRYGNLDKIWPLYNTEQVIPPLWYKGRDKVLRQEGWQLDDEWATEAPMAVHKPENGLMAIGKNDIMIQWLNSLPDAFSISGQVRIAKQIDPNLSTKSRLADYLEANGYYVERGQRWTAYYAGDDGDYQREVEVNKKAR